MVKPLQSAAWWLPVDYFSRLMWLPLCSAVLSNNNNNNNNNNGVWSRELLLSSVRLKMPCTASFLRVAASELQLFAIIPAPAPELNADFNGHHDQAYKQSAQRATIEPRGQCTKTCNKPNGVTHLRRTRSMTGFGLACLDTFTTSHVTAGSTRLALLRKPITYGP